MHKKMSVVIIIIIVLLTVICGLLNSYTKEPADTVAVEDTNNKMTIIDGVAWKRTTFKDEAGRCWWIYTDTIDYVSGMRKVFVIPCGGVR